MSKALNFQVIGNKIFQNGIHVADIKDDLFPTERERLIISLDNAFDTLADISKRGSSVS